MLPFACRLGSALCSRSTCASFKLPASAAWCSGTSPTLFRRFGSAPDFRRYRAASTCPHMTARYKGDQPNFVSSVLRWCGYVSTTRFSRDKSPTRQARCSSSAPSTIMRQFDSRAYFDATFREARFDRFYTDFFNVKMKDFLKEVNRLHYDCSQACITEEAVDGTCIDSCASVYEHFFRHVEGVIQGRLASYPKCLEDCKERLPLAECCDKCIEETVTQLNCIDPKTEFSRFLKFTEWKAKTNIS